MAKQNSIINLRGKVGDTVFTRGKNGYSAKPAPKKGTAAQKKKGKQPQNLRMGALNALAGQISGALKFYGYPFTPGSFYKRLMKRFHLEKSDARILLLDSLERMEVNDDYKFGELYPDMHVNAVEKKSALTVCLDLRHYPIDRKSINCFYMQVIVLMWNSADEVVIHEGKKTDWISFNDPLPLYCDIDFKKPAKASDYLVACRIVTGRNGHSTEDFPSQGIRIFTIGSFTKEGKQLLAERQAARELRQKERPVKREEVKEERVALRRRK